MKKIKYVIIFLIIINNTLLFGTDTLKIMQYNLLYYGVNTGWCTSENNNLSDKDNYLITILDYVKPDIFTVNELGTNETTAIHLLDNTLNINGCNKYDKAVLTNFSNGGYSSITNMLYYNTVKLTLFSQDLVITDIRDINIYTLYYNSPDLQTENDTVFLTCIVGHLKAGSDSEDEIKREEMIETLMNYVDGANIRENLIIMGDFNFYNSSEEACQLLINNGNLEIRFYDPINQMGNWHNNSGYSLYHTQSTHTSSSGCPSTGGMDDRFDFILVSNNILNNTNKVKYIENSYKALAQDASYFNSSLTNSDNTDLPQELINALYNMSDHLPVIMEIEIDQTKVSLNTYNKQIHKINIYDDNKNNICVQICDESKEDLKIQIWSILGQKIYEKNYFKNIDCFKILVSKNKLNKGIYFVSVITDNFAYSKKFICK
ncbi:MAG: T9SS type A sorting domain-containing protein [Bacteroidales bacterium]|nr:T9SS type A sorting domain-containing protein [Bacteroidales bacterium]